MSKYEQLFKDSDRGPYKDFPQNMTLMERYKLDDESDQDKIRQGKLRFAYDKGA